MALTVWYIFFKQYDTTEDSSHLFSPTLDSRWLRAKWRKLLWLAINLRVCRSLPSGLWTPQLYERGRHLWQDGCHPESAQRLRQAAVGRRQGVC